MEKRAEADRKRRSYCRRGGSRERLRTHVIMDEAFGRGGDINHCQTIQSPNQGDNCRGRRRSSQRLGSEGERANVAATAAVKSWWEWDVVERTLRTHCHKMMLKEQPREKQGNNNLLNSNLRTLMAFWGVEVKPGKPVIHSCEKAIGRLRISQATLGISDATKKSIVQCNVGRKSPVLLCALLSNQTESCHLDLEFEEADDVVLSVIGPQSVYLIGYYIRQNQQSGHQSDSESYGVDIQNSQKEESSYQTDDDEYEDSFIDDDEEPQSFSPSPVSRSKEDETASESDKPNKRSTRSTY